MSAVIGKYYDRLMSLVGLYYRSKLYLRQGLACFGQCSA